MAGLTVPISAKEVLLHHVKPGLTEMSQEGTKYYFVAFMFFSVTRRSRSDVSESLTH